MKSSLPHDSDNADKWKASDQQVVVLRSVWLDGIQIPRQNSSFALRV